MPPDADGSEFVILGRDITDRLQARAKDRAIQQVLGQMFQCVDAGVLIASSEGRIYMTNPWLDRLLGHPPGSVVGLPTMALVAPSAYAVTDEARHRAMEHSENYCIESVLLREDGARCRCRSVR
jgi:PAS domain S-box-containing protein